MRERPATIHAFQWARALGAVAIALLHALITVQVAGGFDDLGHARIVVEGCLSVALTRWAVPVFFMMSGALMLDPRREVTWAKIGRHIWRLVFVLLTFGLFFCLVESCIDLGGLSPIAVYDAVIDLLQAHSWDHMWFVYTLVGFYALTPVLRPFIAQAGERELRWTLVFMVVTLQGVNSFGNMTGIELWKVIRLPIDLTWYVLGYYAHTYLRYDWRYGVAAAVSLVCMLALRLAFDYNWSSLPEHAIVVPYGLAAFLAFEEFLEVPVDRHPLVALLADYSFGIYLVHPAFQHAFATLIDVGRYPALLVDLGMTVVPVALSVATIWLLRHVPGFGDKV